MKFRFAIVFLLLAVLFAGLGKPYIIAQEPTPRESLQAYRLFGEMVGDKGDRSKPAADTWIAPSNISVVGYLIRISFEDYSEIVKITPYGISAVATVFTPPVTDPPTSLTFNGKIMHLLKQYYLTTQDPIKEWQLTRLAYWVDATVADTKLAILRLARDGFVTFTGVDAPLMAYVELALNKTMLEKGDGILESASSFFDVTDYDIGKITMGDNILSFPSGTGFNLNQGTPIYLNMATRGFQTVTSHPGDGTHIVSRVRVAGHATVYYVLR